MWGSHGQRRCGGGWTGGKLEVDVVFAKGFFHGVGALIVDDVVIEGCTMME